MKAFLEQITVPVLFRLWKRQKEVLIAYLGRAHTSGPLHHPRALAAAGQHSSHRSADPSASCGGVVSAPLLTAFIGRGTPGLSCPTPRFFDRTGFRRF